MPTLAIVGAGRQFGGAVARVFGGHGFQVALIARRREAVDELATELGELGVTAAGFVADVRDPDALKTALGDVEAQLGPVDVLSYSPLPARDYLHALDETTSEQVEDAFRFSVLGPIAAVGAVLPGMRERRSGTLLFTTGGSALTPNPNVASTSISMAGEAAYAQMLHDTLGPEGIHVAHLVVRVGIAPGADPGDPDELAQKLWQLHEGRDTFRVIIG